MTGYIAIISTKALNMDDHQKHCVMHGFVNCDKTAVIKQVVI